ncbi:MAG: TlpA family protein disulfide reductase [Chloroflexi bacterium]|nr:TlpA family protein disulfide reductase [Chloroflexota bacterium]
MPSRSLQLRSLPLLLAIALLAAGCLPGGQAGPPQVGTAAPDLTVTTLDGSTVRLADLKGQVVLLNFWATTCPPCREEMPDLQAVYSEVRASGGTVLAVDQHEAADTVKRFVDEFQLTFPVGVDADGSLFARYGVQFIPTSFVVDKNGVVRFMKVGQMDRDTIRRYFSTLQ